jgi:hypothetical protein
LATFAFYLHQYITAFPSSLHDPPPHLHLYLTTNIAPFASTLAFSVPVLIKTLFTA